MGGVLGKRFKAPIVKILVLGPDAAGKTTLLYRLKTGRTVSTVPTIGFNVEEFRLKNTRIMLWDVGGQDKIRTLWKHYFMGVSVLAYVVDSSDKERIAEAKETLTSIISDPSMAECVILIYANKQDIDGAFGPNEIASQLGLKEVKQKWHVQPSCALTGDGLYEGLMWAIKHIQNLKSKNQKSLEPKEQNHYSDSSPSK